MNNTKEKEPDTAGTVTSSKPINNTSKYDNTSCCKVCQEQLIEKLDLIKQTLSPELFEDVEEYQVSVPMLSAIIGEAYGMLRMLEMDLKAGEHN